jgi:hypothetical protein
MLLNKLRQVAQQRLPLNVSERDAVDELRVLMTAGLVAALQVRSVADDGSRTTSIRVLAITPDGRRLLQRSARTESPPAAWQDLHASLPY